MIFQEMNEFLEEYAPIYSKFMVDYKGDMYPRGIQRQQECVGWNLEDFVPKEHK
jgi:hypothetical protein